MGQPGSAVLHSMTASWKQDSARTAAARGSAGPALLPKEVTRQRIVRCPCYEIAPAISKQELPTSLAAAIQQSSCCLPVCRTRVPPHFQRRICLLLQLPLQRLQM